MNQTDLSINNLIMQEIGLEVSASNRIIDQDTGMTMTFGGKEIVAPGVFGGYNTVEFDPYNNKRMMNRLFGYFLEKHADESDIGVMTYYNVDNGDKGSIECRMTDQSTITSKPYIRDSLKCTDIIIQLNGGQAPDFSKYDTIKETTVNKKGSRSNAKNKSNSKTTKSSR